MAELDCLNVDKYLSKDGRCCDRCHAGSYMRADCDDTKATECAECGRGLYTATRNHLSTCHVCKVCSSNNNQRKVEDCTAKENAVCECVTGFYCGNDECDICMPVSHCTLGEGVIVKATRTHDTLCAPCEEGTYSNVTDFHSPCQTHTRCEDIGRVLRTPGTRTTDAICGDFKSHCHWMLPMGLWSGLVLTALVLFGLICWWEKRKSYRAARPIAPVALTEMVPATPDSPLDLPWPSTELTGDYQETYTVDGCEWPLFPPGDNVVGGGTRDSLGSCLPITPLKASVSFGESSQCNGSGNFLRTLSEPQEDEWCGT